MRKMIFIANELKDSWNSVTNFGDLFIALKSVQSDYVDNQNHTQD